MKLAAQARAIIDCFEILEKDIGQLLQATEQDFQKLIRGAET